jgi:hypothetical protein
MSFYEDASLVMIPSGYKSGKIYSQKPLSTDGQLTFTRASDATRVASNGLIEKVRTNLFTYSEQLDNAAWTKNVTTITANAIVAPDGTTTADKMADSDTTTAARYTFQSPASSGTIYTSSGYFKKGEYNFVTLHAFGLNGAVFNLDTGVKVSQSGGVGSIVSVGNGWYRCSFAFTAGGSSVFFSQSPAGNISYAGTTGSGIYAWGLQVETGDIATDYIPTTTTAVSVGPVANIPRLDYYDSTCPKLLLEPQRTNLVLFSEQLNAASWSASTTTVTANAEISPDGYQNADVLAMSASQSRVSQVLSLGAGTYSVSVYAKAISGSGTARILVIIDGVSTDFNFTPTTSWARYSFTFTAATSVTAVQMRAQTFIGNLSFWGCQLELGACATSYIPTLATSQTRVADAALKTGITSLIGQTEGTLFVDAEVTNFAEAAQSFITISDGTITNRVELRKGSPNTIILEGSAATGSFPNITLSSVAVGRYKIAVAYKTGSTALFINGTQIGSTSANAFAFTSLTNVIIGANFSGSTRFLNDRISQALVFKTRLTNDQLAELTSL